MHVSVLDYGGSTVLLLPIKYTSGVITIGMYVCIIYLLLYVFMYLKLTYLVIAEKSMKEGSSPIIIDNTNLTQQDMLPYVELVSMHVCCACVLACMFVHVWVCGCMHVQTFMCMIMSTVCMLGGGAENVHCTAVPNSINVL